MSEAAAAAGSVLGGEAGKEPAAQAAGAGEGQTPPAAGKETKPQDAQAGDKGKVGAPEKYEDFKLPEGLEVDKATMEAFLPVAKELGLSQEQAQKLVDVQAAYVQAAAKAQTEHWEKTQSDWVKSAKTDKEIGGAAFNENVSNASKALKQFGTPELMQALDLTGVGNHPEFIRVFSRIGKAISEDKFHVSNAAVPAKPKTWAETLFPNQGKAE